MLPIVLLASRLAFGRVGGASLCVNDLDRERERALDKDRACLFPSEPTAVAFHCRRSLSSVSPSWMTLHETPLVSTVAYPYLKNTNLSSEVAGLGNARSSCAKGLLGMTRSASAMSGTVS